MRLAFHLARHDLRRMAPWLLAYYGYLAWRATTYSLESSVRVDSRLSLLLYLGLLALVGLLVLENPLFTRRAFWRSRPITPLQLLQARWLFTAALIWAPWVVAQWVCHRQAGLEHPQLFGLALGDGALTTAVLLSTFLGLASLCSKPHYLLAPMLLAFSAPPFIQLLPLYHLETYRPLLLRLGLVALGLLLVSILATLAIYQKRTRWMVPLVGVWLLSTLAPIPLSGWLASALRTPPIQTPEGLDLTLAPASDPTVLHSGNHAFVSAAFEPHGLAPNLGLEIVGVQGTLVADTGEAFPLASPGLRANCLLPQTVVEQAPQLDRPKLTLGGCRSRLEVPLIEQLKVRGAPTSGTLELRFRARVFEADLQQVDAHPGASVRVDEKFYRVEAFEEVEVEGSDAPGVRIHLAEVLPIGNGTTLRGFSFTSRFNPVRLLDRRWGILFDVDHGTSRSWSEQVNPLTPFYRLRVDHRDEAFRHTPTPGALPEPQPLPEGTAPYQLLALERVYSETFDLTVRVEDYDLTDFLGRLAG